MGRSLWRAHRAVTPAGEPAGVSVLARARRGRLAAIAAAAAVGVLGAALPVHVLAGPRPGDHGKPAVRRVVLAAALRNGPYITNSGPGGPGGQDASTVADTWPQSGRQASAFRQIILPDVLVVAPDGLTQSQIVRLHKIAGVRNMITFDGAEITAGGRQVSVIGVNPATFRSWVPLRTASDQALWTALSNGEFAASQPASSRLQLKPGSYYRLVGSATQVMRFGQAARLDLAGVDLLVNQTTSAKLGLVRQVAGLISAPGVSLATLTAKVSAVLGPTGKIEVLRAKLPVAAVPAGVRPASYLELFKASAAQYCPGLSWTVLAAIGQIESGDGANIGPSTAGALGPMQFLPSTWAVWGINGFGDTGPPNVFNPYDAVPSAARLLCADGAAAGGRALYNAIYDYNHADWYVREVLALAAEYAANYA